MGSENLHSNEFPSVAGPAGPVSTVRTTVPALNLGYTLAIDLGGH